MDKSFESQYFVINNLTAMPLLLLVWIIGACDGTVEGEGSPRKLAAVNQPKEAHHMADLAQMKHLADRFPPPRLHVTWNRLFICLCLLLFYLCFIVYIELFKSDIKTQ